MIKIAVFPKCYENVIGPHGSMSVFDWISIAENNLAADGLEMYDRFFPSLDERYLSGVRDAAAQAGFQIPMLICAPDFTNPDPDQRKIAIEYQVGMIRTAALLGGNKTVCRVLSGQQYPGVTREQGIAWVVDAIKQVIPVAKEYDVVLGMENHYKDSRWEYPEFALKKDVFLEIISRIDEREFFGVQFDPSNAIIAGDQPIELLEAVKDRVVSMHASDRFFIDGVQLDQLENSTPNVGYSSKLRHGVIGKGLNDYDRIFSILSKNGFSGWISIEDGLNGMGDMQDSLVYLRKMQNKYFPD